MYILHRITAVLIYASTFAVSNVSAHSQQRAPLKYISRVENAIINTPSHRIHALSTFDLTFDLHQGEQTIKLSLAPNHAVIQDGASIQYLGKDGETIKQVEFDRSQYLVYKGYAWLKNGDGKGWSHAGWARVIMHNDGLRPLFEGAFRIHGNHHHVQTRTNFLQTRQGLDPEMDASGDEFLVVWRDTDVGISATVEGSDGTMYRDLKRATGVAPTCDADALSFNTQPDHPVFRALKRDESTWAAMSTKHLFGRQSDGQTFGNSAGINLLDHIGSAEGCSSTRKVALVGIATDCTYTASFESDEELRKNLIKVVNAASVQFEDAFNITLGLKSLTIQPKECPSSPQQATPWNQDCNGPNIQQRLNLFSAWRGTQADSNAYWSLFSKCGSGAAVGLAWLGQACVQAAQVAQSENGVNETVSGANVIVRTDQEWQVFAHETGHTFGAVHDCDSTACAPQNDAYVKSQQCCPLSRSACDAGGRFIMNPSTGNNITLFSPCTIGNICTAIGRNSVKTNCLTQNKDISTIQGSQCGNGIVEQGEQCDCGGVDGCGANSCCDPGTCQFKSGAQCDPSNEDCCSSTCKFANSGTVCRASTGVCDPQETCSGTAAACPVDVTAPDGQSCGGSLTCASGQCTSRDLQCKTIMGSYTANNDTFACSDRECRISCQSPQFGPNTCYAMKQNFLDGTPCTGGGKCSNGMCLGGSFGQEVKSWIDKNKTLVIALASALGGIIVLSLLCCCVSRCRRVRNRNKLPTNPSPSMQQPLNIQSHMMTGAGGAGWDGNDGRRSQRSNLAAYGAGGQQYPRSNSNSRSQRNMAPSIPPSSIAPIQSRGGWRNDGRWDPNMNVGGGGGAGGGDGYSNAGYGAQQMGMTQFPPQQQQRQQEQQWQPPPQPSWQPSVRYA